jgi:hypothetical protein
MSEKAGLRSESKPSSHCLVTFGGGGATETVIEGDTGAHFTQQTALIPGAKQVRMY